MPTHRYNILRGLAYIVTLLLTATASAADPAWQTLHLTDGKKVHGIILRQDATRFTIATHENVLDVRMRQILIRGSITPAAREVNNLLTILENGIAQRSFDRTSTNLRDAKNAVETFSATLDALKRRGTDEQKAASKNGLAFYATKLSEIQPTVQVLKLEREFKDMEAKIITGRSRPSAYMLSDYIKLGLKMNQVPPNTPMAQRQREATVKGITDRLDSLTQALATKAVDRYRTQRTLAQVIELMKVLKTGNALNERYSKTQSIVLNGLPDIVKARRVKLMPAANRILAAGEAFNQAQRDFNKLVADIRSASDDVRTLKPLLFGAAATSANAILEGILSENDAAIGEATARKELILSVRGLYREGQLALSREDFREATEQFRKADTLIRSNKLPGEALLASIRIGLLKARAFSQTTALRTSHQSKSASDVAEIHSRASDFLTNTEKELARHEFPTAVYKKLLSQTHMYHQFRLLTEKLTEASASSNNSDKWTLAGQITNWLDKHRADTFPEAAQQWQTINKSVVQPTVINAHDAFLKGGALEVAHANMLLRVFSDLAGTDPNAISQLIMSALKRPTSEINDGQLSDLISRLTQKLPENAQMALLQDISKTERGKALSTIVQMAANGEKARADALLSDDKYDEALAAYASIAERYPDFASKNRLPEKAASFVLLRVEPMLNDQLDEALVEVEKLCKAFADPSPYAAKLRPLAKACESRLQADWSESKFKIAVEEYERILATYPLSSSAIKLPRRFFQLVARNSNEAYKTAKSEGKSVGRPLQEILETLIATHPDDASTNKLAAYLVQIRIGLAGRYLDAKRVLEAHEIYAGLVTDFPEEATQYQVQDSMDTIMLRYRLAQVQAPLNIADTQDNLAFFLMLLLWPFLLSRALFRGKTRGYVKYRLLHWTTTFTVFTILCAIFVFGKVKFTNAFAFALIPPMLVFNTVGTSSYFFFPLVYHERRFLILRYLVKALEAKIGKFSLASNPVGQKICAPLSAWLARTQEDLPLLHDRWLLRIDKIVRLGMTQPEAAYKKILSLRSSINKELIRDELWEERIRSCAFHTGRLAAELGHRENALQCLQDFTALNPNHVEARRLMAELLITDKRYREALTHLEAAAQHDTSDEVLYYLGFCAFQIGENKTAALRLEQVSQRTRDVLFYGARASARCGDYPRAALWFQQLLKSNRDDHEAIYYLACAFAHHADDQKALKTSALIPKASPFYAGALALQGSIFLRLNRLDNAEEQFIRAMQAAPTSMPALLGYTQLLIETNRLQQATKLAESAINQDPNNYAANYYMGFLMEGQDASKAILHYNKALKSRHFQRVTECRLARIYFFRQEYPMAIRHFRTAAEGGMLTPWFKYLYAYSLAAVGQASDCADILSDLLDQAIDDPDWTSHAGRALYAIGIRLAKHGALAMAIQSMELAEVHIDSPLHVEALRRQLEDLRFQLAIHHILEGRDGEARTLLDGVLSGSLSPERQIQAQYYRGLAAIRSGDYGAALIDFEALQLIQPDNPRFRYHAMVARLGSGQVNEAKSDFSAIIKTPNLPPHLAAGFETVKAHLKARQDQYRDAIMLLKPTVDSTSEFPGAKAVRLAAVDAWLILLAQLQDFATMEPSRTTTKRRASRPRYAPSRSLPCSRPKTRRSPCRRNAH